MVEAMERIPEVELTSSGGNGDIGTKNIYEVSKMVVSNAIIREENIGERTGLVEWGGGESKR